MQWIWMSKMKENVSTIIIYIYIGITGYVLESVLRLKDKVTKRKGRGFGSGATRTSDKVRGYDSVEGGDSDAPGPQKCKLHLHIKTF